MQSNPNALVALLSGLFASAVVWALHNWTGIDLTAGESALVATGAASIMLFIGREGLRNTVGRLWWGSKKEPKPKPKPTEKIAP